MKVTFVNRKELGGGPVFGAIADFINVRFHSFLCKLAEVEGIELNKLFGDVKEILADAEIEQEGRV